jgi:hypothetical protein
MMLRNCFVREEGERLVLCAGVPGRWLQQPESIRFGPTPTPFGSISVTVTPDPGRGARVEWQGDWRGEAPPVSVHLPGFAPVDAGGDTQMVVLEP